MNLSRQTELRLGTASYRVVTELQGGEGSAPVIETEIVCDGEVVYRAATAIEELRPIFKHSQEVVRRIESQHEGLVQKLREGVLATAPKETGAAASEDRLEEALELLSAGELDRAANFLRELAGRSPEIAEARELLEVCYQARSGDRDGIEDPAQVKEAAEAFASGRRRHALEIWKRCLARDPSDRIHQMLVLLGSTQSAERRGRYVKELLRRGSDLLREGRSGEAFPLLLLAQTEESPEPTEDRTEISLNAPALEQEPGDVTLPAADLETVLGAGPPAASDGPDRPPPRMKPPAPEDRQAAFSEAKQRPSSPAAGPRRAGPRAGRSAGSRRPSSSRALPYAGGAALVVLLLAGLSLVFFRGGPAPNERLAEAAAVLSAGDPARAADLYSSVLSEWGDLAPAYLGRGRARIAAGDTDGGVSDLRRAVELEPGSAILAQELGDVLFALQRFAEAIEEYQQAAASGVLEPEARYRLSMSLAQLGREEEALAQLEGVLAEDRSHGEARFLYARLLNRQKRFAEAERELREAQGRIDAGGDHFAELVLALLGQDELEKAEEAARRFVRQYPEDARGFALLGEVYLRRKQYEPARDALIRALQTNPHDARAQLALGRTWIALGQLRGDPNDLAKARQILSQARGAPPGEHALAMGQLALAEGDVGTAIEHLGAAIAGGASPLEARLALSEAKFLARDDAGAASELERAAALAPADAAIPFSLGFVYARLGDPRRAAAAFLEAVKTLGLTSPPAAEAGPIVLPAPYVPLPPRFDVNRTIRDVCRKALALAEEDAAALELQTIAGSASFVLAAR